MAPEVISVRQEQNQENKKQKQKQTWMNAKTNKHEQGKKYSKKVDVYSWAVITWEMITRQQPFKGN